MPGRHCAKCSSMAGEGLTRRANSANPLRPVAHTDLQTCELLYRRLGLPTIFRVLSLTDASVDASLAQAGYAREGESCVLYGPLDALAAAPNPDVVLVSQPTPEWFAAMAALQNHTQEQAATYRRIVAQIAIPAAFAALYTEGEIMALAYGAIHNRLLCYESVITNTARRRRGYGRRIIGALAGWAMGNGAQAACLEVEAGNIPARTLYDAIGLKTELYRYHYRRER
jgi:GNAT superfamily N-acetyltransferase